MKNFVQEGLSLDLIAPAGGVTAGHAVKIGAILAMPATNAAEGEEFAGWVEGVYDHVAQGAGAGQAWAIGDVIYWDDVAKQFTKTAAGNSKAGVAVAVKASPAVEGRIRLIPQI